MVWQIGNLEIRNDRLYADSEMICNGLNSVMWFVEEPEGTQLLICEECWHPCCQPGNYVSLRKVPDCENRALDECSKDSKGFLMHAPLYFMMPSFSEILDDAETPNPKEHLPPHYIYTKGVLCLTDEQLFKFARSLREIAPPLTCAEAARILQWEAPYQCLGQFPDNIALRVERIVSSSEGDLQENLKMLSALLNDLEATKGNCSYRPLHPTDEVISFNVVQSTSDYAPETTPITQWRCLVRSEGKVRNLLVEPGIVLAWDN